MSPARLGPTAWETLCNSQTDLFPSPPHVLPWAGFDLTYPWAILGHPHFSCLPLTLILLLGFKCLFCSFSHKMPPTPLRADLFLPPESHLLETVGGLTSRVSSAGPRGISLVRILYTYAAPHAIRAKCAPHSWPASLLPSISPLLGDRWRPTCQGSTATMEGRKERATEGGGGNNLPECLSDLAPALKTNSQRLDSAGISQLHANFNKSYANNPCDSALDCICLAASQEQASRDHSRWRARGARGEEGGILNPSFAPGHFTYVICSTSIF